MAFVLKDGQTYEDEKTGAVYSNAYAAIDEMAGDKRKKHATVVLKIFSSQALAEAGKGPIATQQNIIRNYTDEEGNPVNDYDTYLDQAIVEVAGNTVISKAYEWWAANHIDTDKWESDEV
jgi:hypothetical protein